MDRKILARRIADIENELVHLMGDICAMDSLDLGRNPETYEAISTEAALRAEKIACRLRSLIYASTGIRKTEYLVKAGKIHGIGIDQEEGIVRVTIPCLLPKKKTGQSSLFLADPLQAALQTYAEEHPTLYFRKCTVCISHVYDRELPDRRIPDHDNIQQKQILDMIALYLMADDSGRLCDVYQTAESGEKDGTRIFVMEQERFPDWLRGYKKGPESISDF